MFTDGNLVIFLLASLITERVSSFGSWKRRCPRTDHWRREARLEERQVKKMKEIRQMKE